MVDLVFGNGETTYHVIVELYSGGNIILTNYVFEVMFLLLCDVSHFHPNAPALACSFVDLATPMIVAPLSYSVSVLRAGNALTAFLHILCRLLLDDAAFCSV